MSVSKERNEKFRTLCRNCNSGCCSCFVYSSWRYDEYGFVHMSVDSSYFVKWNPEVDYRERPDLYEIGRGQQGVLICEPYKSEICKHWRFKTPPEAQVSSSIILKMFYDYLRKDDFVGADMAKKFLHMGFTRSRRYANHRDGRKYDKDGNIIPQEPDAMTCDKAKSAVFFREAWKEARENERYLLMKKDFRNKK